MRRIFGFLLLLLGSSGYVMAQSTGFFAPAGNMTVPRLSPTATLLTNGKVLIVGSQDGPPGYCCISAELYDPVTGAFAPTGNMTTGRPSLTATLLPDGMVLIAGQGLVACSTCGGPGVGLGPTAELYNPVTGTFAVTGSMITHRSGFSATLLSTGKVLIAGGGGDAGSLGETSAELYDPCTGTFTRTGDMINGREQHTATLLSNGKVLIAGGVVGGFDDTWVTAAELYDPATGTFSAVGGTEAFSVLGIFLADLLPDGTVLGLAYLPESSAGLAGLVYEPSTATFHATGNRTAVEGTATLLPDGTVLTAGWSRQDIHHSADIYDLAKGTFAATGKLNTPRVGHTATLLPDGTVLVCGGWDPPGAVRLSSAEIYHPPVAIPAPVLYSLPDGSSQGAVLHAGTTDVATARDPAMRGEILEIYGSGLLDRSVIPPQVSIGGRMAEVLFFGNAPGYSGLNQINVRVPGGIAPGPAVPVRLIYLGRPSNEVTIGVQ